tara:strand:+ start:281 stop:619 length:339 start_codon:yes stop_codon:yes gene_type:complete
MSWFSILKKYNFPLMKTAMRNVVDKLNGEAIETHTLSERLIDEYKQLILKYGTRSEKAGVGKLKDKTSVRPFIKLIREYGYTPKKIGGTMGSVSESGLGSRNAILDTIRWEL